MAEKKNKSENVMRNIRIEKIVLSVGGVAGELEKGVLLLKLFFAILLNSR